MLQFTVPLVVQSLVLLLVRVVLAIAFYTEARIKFKDIKSFAKQDGLPLSVAYAVTIAELAAAISMLSGLMAQWAGAGIILLMIATIGLHVFKWRSPYGATKRGWEYDLLLLVLAAAVVAFGAGQFAITL